MTVQLEILFFMMFYKNAEFFQAMLLAQRSLHCFLGVVGVGEGYMSLTEHLQSCVDMRGETSFPSSFERLLDSQEGGIP